MNNNTTKAKYFSWINLLLLLIMVAVNYSGAAGLINGMSQKAVSGMYSTLITPAGYAFAIWGVIYALLFATIIQLIIQHKKEDVALLINETSVLFWLSVVFNIAWTICFSHLNMLLALMFIVSLLLMLKLIALKMNDNKRLSKFRLASSAIGLYAGWVSVASFVNLAALTVQIRWSGFGLERSTWAMITLIVALLLVTAVTLKIKNVVYLLGVFWAYLAILMAHRSPKVFDNAYFSIQVVLVIGMVYIAALAGSIVYKKFNA